MWLILIRNKKEVVNMMCKNNGKIVDVSYFNHVLCDDINQIANGLIAAGVKKGLQVALLLPACRQREILYHAITRIGAVPVWLNETMLHKEVSYFIHDSDCKVLITSNFVLGNSYDSSIFKGLKSIIFFEETISEDLRVTDLKTIIEIGGMMNCKEITCSIA